MAYNSVTNIKREKYTNILALLILIISYLSVLLKKVYI